MFKDEDDFRRKLQFEMEGLGFKTQAHEDSIVTGIPDMSYSGFGGDGWVELKYVRNPRRSINYKDMKFTAKQREWLREFGARGQGHHYLIIAVKFGPDRDDYYRILPYWMLADADGVEWSHPNSGIMARTLNGVAVELKRRCPHWKMPRPRAPQQL